MFSRRQILLTAAQATLPESGVSTRVFAADDFVESVGVNTHFASLPYRTRVAGLRERLAVSGIRHIRDEFRPSDNLDLWRELFDRLAIRANLVVSPTTNSPAELMLALRRLGVAAVSAVEGQNEGDSDWFKAQPQARPDWARAAVAYQREIYTTLRTTYSAATLPVVSPSIIDWKPDDVPSIRDAAPYCDIVAVHSYPQHGQPPETRDDYASLAWYLRTMRDAFKPGAPAMATETGYCTLVRPHAASISEAAAGKYLPRLLLGHFVAGVQRSFLYELLDEGTDRTDGEQNYGLLRADLTAKPAYTAISRLLAALADKGPRLPPAAFTFRFTLDGADESTRTVAFARRDGSVVLALWQAAACWDVGAARDVANPTRSVDISVGPHIAGASMLVLNEVADGWRRVPMRGNRFGIAVGDDVTLLKLVA